MTIKQALELFASTHTGKTFTKDQVVSWVNNRTKKKNSMSSIETQFYRHVQNTRILRKTKYPGRKWDPSYDVFIRLYSNHYTTYDPRADAETKELVAKRMKENLYSVINDGIVVGKVIASNYSVDGAGCLHFIKNKKTFLTYSAKGWSSVERI